MRLFNDTGKLIKNTFIMFAAATLLGVALLCLVYLIPDSAVLRSFKSLEETIELECPERADEKFFTYAYGSKNIPDTFISQLTLKGDTGVLKAAMGGITGEGSGDQRYWDGFMVLIRPLMVFFSYGQIRYIMSFIMILLLWYVITKINDRLYRSYSFAFTAGLILINFIVNLFGVMIGFDFLIMLAFMAFILKYYETDRSGDFIFSCFFLDGILTAYLDRYTACLITLEMPLLIIILLNMKEYGRDSLNKNIKNTICGILGWGMGWTLFWSVKWVIATPILERNVLSSALGQAAVRGTTNARSVSDEISGYTGNRFFTILKNICSIVPTHGENLLPVAVLGIAVILLFIVYAVRVKAYIPEKKQYAPLIVLMLVPYVYYFVLSNLCQIHATFYMYRMQLITLTGVLIIYFDAVRYGRDRKT